MPVPAGMQWTREYLRNKGIPNQDITWNPQTSAVSVYGQELKPQYGESGKSFASMANLDKFWSSLQPTAQMNQLMGQINQMQNFQYNPQADPSFQQAQKGITRSVLNTMQDRGLLLSTQTPERIAQATAEAVPQFESAAARRNQQNLQNLFSLAQTIQQQKQAEEDAKRQQEYVALNQLNTLSGLTGTIPGIGSQFGLTPGALTASEQARRAAAASASAGSAPSLVQQMREQILSGKLDPSTLSPVQLQALGLDAPGSPVASAQKQLNDIVAMMVKPEWGLVPKETKQFYEDLTKNLQSFIASGGATQPGEMTLQESEIPDYIARSRAGGLTDDQIRERLASYGYNPDKYLRKPPTTPKTSPWEHVYQSWGAPTTPASYIGGAPYGQR